jgi:hypothetical protein
VIQRVTGVAVMLVFLSVASLRDVFAQQGRAGGGRGRAGGSAAAGDSSAASGGSVSVSAGASMEKIAVTAEHLRTAFKDPAVFLH